MFWIVLGFIGYFILMEIPPVVPTSLVILAAFFAYVFYKEREDMAKQNEWLRKLLMDSGNNVGEHHWELEKKHREFAGRVPDGLK
jgi:hypothetical protein